jgi:Domain of unknown function (DUF6984)
VRAAVTECSTVAERMTAKRRSPTIQERRLLALLAADAPDMKVAPSWLDQLEVENMTDGGMGSLRLFLPGGSEERRFAQDVATYEFNDADGVSVSAALYVDQDRQPFELDIWKTDSSPLIRIPDELPPKLPKRSRRGGG